MTGGAYERQFREEERGRDPKPQTIFVDYLLVGGVKGKRFRETRTQRVYEVLNINQFDGCVDVKFLDDDKVSGLQKSGLITCLRDSVVDSS